MNLQFKVSLNLDLDRWTTILNRTRVFRLCMDEVNCRNYLTVSDYVRGIISFYGYQSER